MSQSALARKAGIPQPMISRIVSGKWRNLTLLTLQKISSVLGLSPEIRLHALGTSKNRKTDGVPPSAACFWDVAPSTVHLPEHAFFVSERILNYGGQKEIRWLLRHVGYDTLNSVIKTSRNLSPKSASLWAKIFHIPAGEILCSKKR